MKKPTQTELQALGISQTYASLILRDERVPSRPLAIVIYRKTGWKHKSISSLSEQDMQVLERIEPWQPKSEAA